MGKDTGKSVFSGCVETGGPHRRQRLPRWLKVRIGKGKSFATVDALLRDSGLNTVCRSALCPNVGQCFERGTATFLILGKECTRQCRFCAIEHGIPRPPDHDEPDRIAGAVEKLGLRYAVLTSVTRDDLADGGAAHFAETVKAIRARVAKCRIELLIPDFAGDQQSLDTVLEAAPDVLNHNIETVPRLYSKVRPGADYDRSIRIIRQVSRIHGNNPEGNNPKSGIMVGLGETEEELIQVMEDLAEAGCRMFTIGQYLQPSTRHLPVAAFYPPERFEALKRLGESIGFSHVEAGPLVRSSYMADRQFSF